MSAYLVADIEITDPEGYAEYGKAVVESIAAFGGRFIVRGGAIEVREGAWSPKRLVILEFPSMERLRAWYDSPEYAPMLALRKRSAVANLLLVEGVPGTSG
jgi:uncharacterized protein (DUF1330 family)